MAHLPRHVADVIVMVPEANVDRHAEAVGNGFGVIEPSLVLEVKIVVQRWIVVEIVAEQENLFDGGRERVDEIPRSDEARRGDQDALVIFDSVLTAFHIKVVDDVGIRNEGNIKASSSGLDRDLTRPQRAREVGSKSSGGEDAKPAASKFHIEPISWLKG